MTAVGGASLRANSITFILFGLYTVYSSLFLALRKGREGLILDAYRQVEAVAATRLLESLPQELRPAYAPLLREEDPDIHALVKAADKLCAYLKCLEEILSGNREFADAARQTLASLRDMNMPEIDWFLERFAPAFGLTLDGLQGR